MAKRQLVEGARLVICLQDESLLHLTANQIVESAASPHLHQGVLMTVLVPLVLKHFGGMSGIQRKTFLLLSLLLLPLSSICNFNVISLTWF